MPNRFGVEIDLDKSWDDGVKGIRNCQFKFECDKKWGDLQVLEGQENVRFCAHCLDCSAKFVSSQNLLYSLLYISLA